MDGGAERLHALDAVRGGALVLGVFFHAALSFVPGPQVWIVMDASRSTELSVLFYLLHIFRMTVFFVLAGFFARLLLERRGAKAFVLNRAKRIALPLAMFWPISITAIVAVAIWGAAQANGGAMPEGPPPPPLTAQTFPLTHLWFLYVLLIFYALALALRGLASVVDRGGALRARVGEAAGRAFGGIGAPILLAAPVAAAFYLTPDWYGWFGIPTPDTGLVPKPTSLLIYGVAFGFGWLLHRQQDILAGWRATWPLHAVAAIFAMVGCVMMAGVIPVLAPAERNLQTLGYAALYAYASWAWTIAIIGFAVRHLSSHSCARRYLADASYWIYLVHLPVVLVLQALFAPLDWPWFAKYPLILWIAFSLMLVSYHWFVRYSFIGAILNGRRRKPEKTRGADPQLAAAE